VIRIGGGYLVVGFGDTCGGCGNKIDVRLGDNQLEPKRENQLENIAEEALDAVSAALLKQVVDEMAAAIATGVRAGRRGVLVGVGGVREAAALATILVFLAVQRPRTLVWFGLGCRTRAGNKFGERTMFTVVVVVAWLGVLVTAFFTLGSECGRVCACVCSPFS
jgi:hypothetical protein